MVGSVDWDVTRPISAQVESRIREFISNLVIFTSINNLESVGGEQKKMEIWAWRTLLPRWTEIARRFSGVVGRGSSQRALSANETEG